MTRRRHRHRGWQDLPADELLTPGTFNPEIALAPVLPARVERLGVLTQTAALLPYRACPRYLDRIPLPQLAALQQHGVRLHG
jgi:hypothetical protein